MFQVGNVGALRGGISELCTALRRSEPDQDATHQPSPLKGLVSFSTLKG